MDSFHLTGWTLKQFQILSLTKQKIAINTTSSTAKTTMDAQPWHKKTMVYRPVSGNTYPKAVFVHGSSHGLNLLVHDMNYVADMSNTTGTVKYINYSVIVCCVKSDGAQNTKVSAYFQSTVVIYMRNWMNWRQTSMSHRVRVIWCIS